MVLENPVYIRNNSRRRPAKDFDSQKGHPFKLFLKTLFIILLILVLAFAALTAWLTIREYRPEARESLPVSGEEADALKTGRPLKILSWNIGYGALGDSADYWMDGGKMVNTADKAGVEENLSGIEKAISTLSPDIACFQEVDRNATRSHGVDETAALAAGDNTFAKNFSVDFIPVPLPPIGHVEAGILTTSSNDIISAERVALPCPFSWPSRIVNLKRCLSVNRLPIEGKKQELVLINLHLEAYDQGEGKAAQTKVLADLMKEEADKGNYVIACGDFNQTFSNVSNPYPVLDGKWKAGLLDTTAFGDDFTFSMDTGTPTCRSLDRPYAGSDPTDFQYYMLDGFITSKNVRVIRTETKDLSFKNSDHNPVVLTAVLQ